MSDWNIYQLKELTTKIGSGATPRGGQEAYKEHGISLIRSQNILDFTFSISGLAYIDQEQANALKNVIIENEDVLINITGDSVARVSRVPSEILPARVNQHVAIIRPDRKKLDSDYLLYYLLNPSFKKYLLRIASDGATRNALTKTDLEELIIKAPEEVEVQKGIAELISVYDKKRVLLQQQNQTLEELAQTLFKRWFVEFEFPNEDGEPYKSSGGRMVESELGEIPEGWRVGTLSEIADISIGRTPPRKESIWFSQNNEDIKWISIKDMGESGVFINNTSEYLTREAVQTFRIPTIPKDTTIVSFKLTVGRVCITNEEMLSNEAIAHIRLREEYNCVQFSYLLLKSYNYDRLGSTSSIATAVNSNSIKNMEILIPVSDVVIKFNSCSAGIFNKIKNNISQIQTLSTLRDTLLPKLMTGDIRVKESY